MTLGLKSVYRFTLVYLATILLLLFSSWPVAEAPICTVCAQTPPLKIEQTATVNYTHSSPHITYETLVTNQGTLPLSGVLITDVLPAQASLLYFSHSEGTQWLSTQQDTAEGRVVLWLNQGDFAPGTTARLTYVVEVPPGDVRSAGVKKDLPIAHVEDVGKIVYQGEVGVAFEQAWPSSPTAAIASSPQPLAAPSLVKESASTPVTKIEFPTAAIQMPEPSPVSTLAEATVPALTPSGVPGLEQTGGMFPVIPMVIILIVVLLAVIIWLLTKKR